jgi:hypothetical protein
LEKALQSLLGHLVPPEEPSGSLKSVEQLAGRDPGQGDLVSYDGSHLQMESARLFSRSLAWAIADRFTLPP